MGITGRTTEYGFVWGPAKVERACSDQKKGWVALAVRTDKEFLQVYVTKTGKVRIYDKHQREWGPQTAAVELGE